MERSVEPEVLDGLTAADPRADHSRADLRLLNSIMGHPRILAHALREALSVSGLPQRPLRLVELGAGDGTVLLKVARRLSPLGIRAEVTLLDRQELVSTQTRQSCASLQWPLESLVADVFGGLEAFANPVDVILCNLFLHHFPRKILAALLCLASTKTSLFIACEPRRAGLALAASHGLLLLGCNAVTRHDAVVSVRAGFRDQEISEIWPVEGPWTLRERSAGLFSHSFVARRHG